MDRSLVIASIALVVAVAALLLSVQPLAEQAGTTGLAPALKWMADINDTPVCPTDYSALPLRSVGHRMDTLPDGDGKKLVVNCYYGPGPEFEQLTATINISENTLTWDLPAESPLLKSARLEILR